MAGRDFTAKSYLSPSDVLSILKAARESSTRDWCMFLLTFRHALRSQEARQLKISDVDLDGMSITVARVKGSRSGVQSLDRHRGEPALDEVAALRAWLRMRVEDGSRILFPSQKGGMLTRMQFLRLFRKYAQLAGVAHGLAHPHALWAPFARGLHPFDLTGQKTKMRHNVLIARQRPTIPSLRYRNSKLLRHSGVAIIIDATTQPNLRRTESALPLLEVRQRLKLKKFRKLQLFIGSQDSRS